MELPAVAGHTLTARRGLSLLLVGGYSPESGFNQQLLEYQLATGTWVSGAQSGTPPTGGHSTFDLPAIQGFVYVLSTSVPYGHCPPCLVISMVPPTPTLVLREPSPEKFSFSIYAPTPTRFRDELPTPAQ